MNIPLKLKLFLTRVKNKTPKLLKLVLFSKRILSLLLLLLIITYLIKHYHIKIDFDIDKINKWYDRKITPSEASSSSLLPRGSLLSPVGIAPEGPTQLLINTSNCKIPEFLPWSDAAKKLLYKKCTLYFWKEPNCQENALSWTYINESHLHVNLTAVKDSGYSWNTIRCCYKVITRVEQSLDDYDMMADRKIKYSEECFPITQPKQLITAEFIRVFCKSTSIPLLHDIIHREFYAIAQTDKTAAEKIQNWKDFKSSNQFLPPNVFIIGVDTMSRLNSHRTLNGTLSFLRSLGAIELKGYTKVGETTFPNTVAFMSGYHLHEIGQFCYKTVQTPQDLCPYLFQPFNKVGYLTAEIDDVPLGTSFNFLKAGFVKKPTDFYLRPMMLAVMKHLLRENNWYVKCLGSRRIEQVMFDYLHDILRVSESTPVFAHLWLATLAHECSAAASYGDPVLTSFLSKIDKENTILFFMSDHGEVFGEFRETVQGWYEDKLPTMWIYLPERLKTLHPEWISSLKTNSNRLTSHFDLYKTLLHILETFDPDRKAFESYSRLPRQKGQSIFKPVAEHRSCTDAGIPEGYCACTEPKSIQINNANILKAADIALQYIINMLPEQCEIPKLGEILQAKYFVTPDDYKVYIIRFTTEPGHFMFEGTVKEEFTGDQKSLVVANDVLRMNKITRRVDCITIPLLERYCYCK